MTSPTTTRMKVFLSHSTKDNDFVEKLAARHDAPAASSPGAARWTSSKGANFVAEDQRRA